MIRFDAFICRFEKHGEKTGWTYLRIPQEIAGQLQPGCRTSFRIRGKLDHHPIAGAALLPMGGGDFILALNAAMRKALKKPVGASVQVLAEKDATEKPLSADLLDCLADEPAAAEKFEALSKGHQRYFSNWIESAKTDATRAKRIAHTLRFLALGKNYGEMIRALKEEREW